jgi:hypothetical protein
LPQWALGSSVHQKIARQILQDSKNFIVPVNDKCPRCAHHNISCVFAPGHTKCAYCTAKGSAPSACKPNPLPADTPGTFIPPVVHAATRRRK